MSASDAAPSAGPLARYREDQKHAGFQRDSAQETAIQHLQSLYEKLVAAEERHNRPAKRMMRKLRRGREEPVTGLYFWGGVGRGKTYMMDLFYDSLPFERKLRVHFHRFMQRVHRELAELEGHSDPLDTIAERFAAECRVICFDEFFVSEIGDAMILANLLDGLFHRGVTLVCTSNIEPDGLYWNGLQRARFLPAIDLLNRYTKVLNIDGGVDYRLRTLEQAQLFHTPLGPEAEESLLKSYEELALTGGDQGQDLEINGRLIHARRHADDVVWFEFRELCDGPRSQNDYIELAREFHAVILSNVPVMGADSDDRARRFINLVDEFYDRCVKLIISAEAPIPDLYTGSNLAFEFERTESRLLEMQSHDYLELPHKA